ncbi:MAG TPA: hypothetical protein VEH84_10270 [Alphaproteobacteria bacterium]|nr:hypothetical protein [Alphaproteobacteria bacterium]
MATQREPPADAPPTTGEDHVPRPPSREEAEQLSEAQALITDEWTGDRGEGGPEAEPGEGRRDA